jgi:hypothetical protein
VRTCLSRGALQSGAGSWKSARGDLPAASASAALRCAAPVAHQAGGRGGAVWGGGYASVGVEVERGGAVGARVGGVSQHGAHHAKVGVAGLGQVQGHLRGEQESTQLGKGKKPLQGAASGRGVMPAGSKLAGTCTCTPLPSSRPPSRGGASGSRVPPPPPPIHPKERPGHQVWVQSRVGVVGGGVEVGIVHGGAGGWVKLSPEHHRQAAALAVPKAGDGHVAAHRLSQGGKGGIKAGADRGAHDAGCCQNRCPGPAGRSAASPLPPLQHLVTRQHCPKDWVLPPSHVVAIAGVSAAGPGGGQVAVQEREVGGGGWLVLVRPALGVGGPRGGRLQKRSASSNELSELVVVANHRMAKHACP